MELNQFRDVDLVIDKANDNFIQRQFVSQGDYKGRTLTVQVTDNGLIGQVPGLMLNLRWQNKASGLADLSAFERIDVENSVFSIEYPEQMMTPGKVIANIQVIQNGKVTHLKSFELTVQNLAGEMTGIVEQAEYGALVAVLADANKFRTDIDNLAFNKASKNEVFGLINGIGSGVPKETFDNLAKLQAKYPNGADSVMLVLEADGKTGYVYSWTGNGWTKGTLYQSQGIADESIDFNKITNTSSKIISSKKWDIVETAAARGYNRFLDLPFENGGIVYSSGADMNSVSSVRTPSTQKLSFSGTIKIFNDNNSVYRYRFVQFNADGTYDTYVGWADNAEREWVLSIDKYYRFEVGRKDGLAIDLEDAVLNFKIVQADDFLGYSLTNLYAITDYQINIGANGKPTFDSSGQTLTITMPNYDLFYFNGEGKQLFQSAQQFRNQLFRLENNQVLVWNLDDNLILVQNNTSTRNRRNVLLANNIYGNITNGYFVQFWQEYQRNLAIKNSMQQSTAYFKENMQDKVKKITVENALDWSSQGMTFVGDKFWNCNGSSDDHSTNSNIRVYGDDLSTRLGSITHNLGHMNTVDYNQNTDTVIVGNASDNTTDNPPCLYLIKNTSEIQLGSHIAYDDTNLVLQIPLTGLHDYGVGACWGEEDFIVYLMVGGKPGTTEIVKLMFGMGTNDLSASGYGTYTEVTENEYNGTAKILSRYSGVNLGVNQDCFYHNGFIYGAFSRYYGHLAKLRLYDESYSIVESWWLPAYNNDGTTDNMHEANGCCLNRGLYLRTSFKNQINEIPIFNRQGGRGKTNERVVFDFEMNGTPIISFSPTSPTTDLYVAEIDNKGFTVLSASNSDGMFDWYTMVN